MAAPLVARIMVEHSGGSAAGGAGPPTGPGVGNGGGSGLVDQFGKAIKSSQNGDTASGKGQDTQTAISQKLLAMGKKSLDAQNKIRGGVKDHIAKTMGVSFGISSILKQSQVFTGFLGSVFQLMGALVDVILAPFLPILIPAIRLMAQMIPIAAQYAKNLFNFIKPVLNKIQEFGAGFHPKFKQGIKNVLVAVLMGLFITKILGFWKIMGAFRKSGTQETNHWLKKLTNKATKPGSIYTRDVMGFAQRGKGQKMAGKRGLTASRMGMRGNLLLLGMGGILTRGFSMFKGGLNFLTQTAKNIGGEVTKLVRTNLLISDTNTGFLSRVRSTIDDMWRGVTSNLDTLRVAAKAGLTSVGTRIGVLDDSVVNKVGVLDDTVVNKVGLLDDTVGNKLGVVDDTISTKLGTLTDDVNTKMSTLTDDYNTKMSTLTDDVNAKVSTLTDDVNSRLGTVDDSINSKVATLSDDVKVKMTTLTDDINTRMGTLDDTVSTKMGTLNNDLNTKLKTLTDDANAKLTMIDNDVNTKVGTLTDDLNTKVGTLTDDYNAKMKTLNDDYKAKMRLLNDDVNTKLGAIDDTISTKVGTLNEDLNTKVTSLTEDYNAKMKTLNDDVNTKLGNIDESVKAKVSALNDDLSAKLTTIDNSVNTKMTSLNEDVKVKLKTLNDTTGGKLTTSDVTAHTKMTNVDNRMYAVQQSVLDADIHITGAVDNNTAKLVTMTAENAEAARNLAKRVGPVPEAAPKKGFFGRMKDTVTDAIKSSPPAKALMAGAKTLREPGAFKKVGMGALKRLGNPLLLLKDADKIMTGGQIGKGLSAIGGVISRNIITPIRKSGLGKLTGSVVSAVGRKLPFIAKTALFVGRSLPAIGAAVELGYGAYKTYGDFKKYGAKAAMARAGATVGLATAAFFDPTGISSAVASIATHEVMDRAFKAKLEDKTKPEVDVVELKITTENALGDQSVSSYKHKRGERQTHPIHLDAPMVV